MAKKALIALLIALVTSPLIHTANAAELQTVVSQGLTFITLEGSNKYLVAVGVPKKDLPNDIFRLAEGEGGKLSRLKALEKHGIFGLVFDNEERIYIASPKGFAKKFNKSPAAVSYKHGEAPTHALVEMAQSEKKGAEMLGGVIVTYDFSQSGRVVNIINKFRGEGMEVRTGISGATARSLSTQEISGILTGAGLQVPRIVAPK